MSTAQLKRQIEELTQEVRELKLRLFPDCNHVNVAEAQRTIVLDFPEFQGDAGYRRLIRKISSLNASYPTSGLTQVFKNRRMVDVDKLTKLLNKEKGCDVQSQPFQHE